MSFKREGNDINLLNKLRKRRIEDLVSEAIPEDEAKLLSNGRFACTLCPHYPIFDTVSMLLVHRNGKKHLHSQDVNNEKKKELNHLIAIRKHEQFLKDGTTNIKMASSNVHGWSKATPYDPRVRKRIKQGDRKPRLDLSESSSNSLNTVSSIHTHEPRTSSAWRDIFQQQAEGPVQHDKQLKNIFRPEKSEPFTVVPYKSSRVYHGNNDSKLRTGIEFSDTPSSSDSSHAVESLQQQEVDNTSALKAQCSYSQLHSSCNLTISGSARMLPHSSGFPNQMPSDTCTMDTCRNNIAEQNIEKPKSMSKSPNSKSALESDSTRLQKYKLLQGSGWKRDWDGKWIQDENAEFDSDEEPPDVA